MAIPASATQRKCTSQRSASSEVEAPRGPDKSTASRALLRRADRSGPANEARAVDPGEEVHLSRGVSTKTPVRAAREDPGTRTGEFTAGQVDQ